MREKARVMTEQDKRQFRLSTTQAKIVIDRYVSYAACRIVTGDSHKFSKEEDDTPRVPLPSEIAFSTVTNASHDPLV